MIACVARIKRPAWQRFFAMSARSMCANTKSDLKEQILRQSFTHVREYGWTDESLLRGIKDLGLSPLNHTIVDRGAVEIVEYFLKEKNKHVKELFTVTNNESEAGNSDRACASPYQVIEAHFDYIRFAFTASYYNRPLTSLFVHQTIFTYLAQSISSISRAKQCYKFTRINDKNYR